MKFELRAAIDAMNAPHGGAGAAAGELFVQTDTRGLERGATFLALRGENFDGHDFVAEAFARGAACAIVEDPQRVPAGRPALIVGDTLAAYLALGALARRSLAGRSSASPVRPERRRPSSFCWACCAARGSPARRRRKTRTTKSASPSSCAASNAAIRASRSSRWARASIATSTCWSPRRARSSVS